jgi:hypothetical protein
MSIYCNNNYGSLYELKKEYNIETKQLNNTTKEIYYRPKNENKKLIHNSYFNSFNEKYIKNIELFGLNIDTLNKLKRKIENCKISFIIFYFINY